MFFLAARIWVAISAKKHKRQRRKRQSVTAKREKSPTPKVLTATRDERFGASKARWRRVGPWRAWCAEGAFR